MCADMDGKVFKMSDYQVGLTALKYTDKDGVTRDLTLYTWNGKLVIVEDVYKRQEADRLTLEQMRKQCVSSEECTAKVAEAYARADKAKRDRCV